MGCRGTKEKKEGEGDNPKTGDDAKTVEPVAVADPRKDPVDTDRPPKVDGQFKNGGPQKPAEGTAYPCFQEGLLYRVVNGDTWYFYNDTVEYEMFVTWRFAANSSVKALGDAKLELTPSKEFVVTMSLEPAATKPFMCGVYDAYKSSFAAKPLSEAYRERMRKRAELRVREDLDNCIQLAQGRTDPALILSSCVLQQVPFVDLTFRPVQKSIARPEDKRNLPFMAWMRPTHYLARADVERICLMDGVSVTDIDQGQLGDCWFLCAVASLAEPEYCEKLVNMFRHPRSLDVAKKERAMGGYRVTINKHGWWHHLVLDDYLPCMAGVPVFAKNLHDHAEMWVSLLQKAYAKLHGSYAAITGGDVLHALQDLTGYPTARLDDEWQEAVSDAQCAAALATKLHDYKHNGALLNINSPSVGDETAMRAHDVDSADALENAYREAGLGMGHAYSVLSVKAFPEHGLTLFHIRNPWSHGQEWSGPWCDSSSLWDDMPDVAAECDFAPADDGAFWMEWRDVQRFFDGAGVCFVKFDWFDYRVRGEFQAGYPSIVVEVTAREPCEGFVTLSQRDRRGLQRDDPDYVYAPLMVAVCCPHVTRGKHRVHHWSTAGVVDAVDDQDEFEFTPVRDVSLYYRFEASDRPYLIVPRTYGAASKDFTLGLVMSLGVGPMLSIKFRNLRNDSDVFDNMMTFAYDDDASHPIRREYQYNPEVGAPLCGEGTEVTFTA